MAWRNRLKDAVSNIFDRPPTLDDKDGGQGTPQSSAGVAIQNYGSSSPSSASSSSSSSSPGGTSPTMSHSLTSQGVSRARSATVGVAPTFAASRKVEPPPQMNLDELMEDSPIVREKIRLMEQKVEDVGLALKKVLKMSKTFQQSGTSYRDANASFVSEMSKSDIKNLSNSGDDALIEKLFFRIMGAMNDLNEYQSMLMMQLESVFIQPLESMLKQEIKEVKEESKNYQRSKSKYDQTLSKHSHIKRPEAEKIQEVEQDLSVVKRQYQEASIRFSHKLLQSHSNTRVETIERLCAFFVAQKAFFHQAYTLCQDVEPCISEISRAVQNSRAHISSQSVKQKQEVDQFEQMCTQGIDSIKEKDLSEATEHQGYLFQKSGNRWKRKFFVIKDGLFNRLDKVGEPNEGEVTLQHLLLCTVRPTTDTERRFCFELISPNDSLLLQAENEKDMQEWFKVIQNVIAQQLNTQQPHSNKMYKDTNPHDRKDPNGILSILRKDPANTLCADCRSKDPDWASINLGILICINCAGIHRRLGTHISKVRSATLDTWDREIKKTILAMGNSVGGAVFEATVSPFNQDIPTPSSDRNTMEEWIKRKYVDKEFLAPLNMLQNLDLLHISAESGDLKMIVALIAHGMNINYQNASNMTALQVACSAGQLTAACLLVQNGAETNTQDANGWTALHHAVSHNHVECAVLLLRHGALLNIKDKSGFTALDISVQYTQAHCVTLLRLAMHSENDRGGSNVDNESFATALKEFSEEYEHSVVPERQFVQESSDVWASANLSDESEGDEKEQPSPPLPIPRMPRSSLPLPPIPTTPMPQLPTAPLPAIPSSIPSTPPRVLPPIQVLSSNPSEYSLETVRQSPSSDPRRRTVIYTNLPPLPDPQN
eukprot:TRINITY_DN3455_c0_g1_i1.p1 TRINITY_DN3455_c0_g1~~TRINITY_DN3455_c0_g1_i1.p1  ORF type:complete len:883 (+),score=333.27 TRINITY_DN3455_c0_g1_i1:52-2700(+)